MDVDEAGMRYVELSELADICPAVHEAFSSGLNHLQFHNYRTVKHGAEKVSVGCQKDASDDDNQ